MTERVWNSLREFAEKQMAHGRTPVPVVEDPTIPGGGVKVHHRVQPFIYLSERAFADFADRLAGDERESDLFNLVASEEKGST